jgi:hypothetical protein
MQRSIERALFDHLVGAGEQRKWNDETEPLSGFKIESHLKSPGRSLGFSPLRMRPA